MRMSESQKVLLEFISSAESEGREAWVQYGIVKPFKAVTIRSLQKRGLITVKPAVTDGLALCVTNKENQH